MTKGLRYYTRLGFKHCLICGNIFEDKSRAKKGVVCNDIDCYNAYNRVYHYLHKKWRASMYKKWKKVEE